MNYTEQKIADTLETNYMPYAMSVIVSRAIPEIDGFKPAHRKLLYTMYKMGLLGSARTKSANIVGQTMKLNPHGDSAIYETMVRLTRGNMALLHPFIDSKGNFGKQYSKNMAYAAARYTEAKLDSICKEIFSEIDKNAVDLQDNYDGTLKEPKLLPVTFPNILVNPNEGIAVGMASKICSCNLREVCETTIALLSDENFDLLTTLKAPDFPGGGEIIYDENVIRSVYETGKGGFKVRGKYSYDKKNSIIEITEIPYSTTVEAIMDKIVDGIKAGKLKDITDVRDESDRSGLKLTLDIKKSTDVPKLMNMLFKTTPLQDTFSCNFNILINGSPKVLGVREILLEWIKFRVICVKRTLEYDMEKKKARLHLLRGLEKILLDIDKAIKIIRDTEKDSDVIPVLMSGFGIDEIQAEYVADIKLRNLNKEYILKNIQDVAGLEADIQKIIMTLSSERRIKKVIAKQLEEISKKYGKDRNTTLIPSEQAELEFSPDMYIDDYSLKLFLTGQGYLKKISLVSLRASNDQKLKENDTIIQTADATNKQELLLFTNKCTVYTTKIYEIPDSIASQLGEYTPNLLKFSEGESVISIVPVSKYEGSLLMCFEDGRITKVPLESYSTKTNRKMLTKAYSAHSPIINVIYIKEDCDIVCFGSNEKALTLNTVMIPEKSTRSSQGVKVFNPGKRGTMISVKKAEDSGIADLKPYKCRNIPAAGAKISAQDKDVEQLSILDL